MIGRLRKRLQKTVVQGLTELCWVLDEVPTVGRDYELFLPGEEEPDDDVVITAGGFRIYRHGAWGSRFTLLPIVSAGLDGRWGTGVWDVPAEDAEPSDLASVASLPVRPAPAPTAPPAGRPIRRRPVRRRLRTRRRNGPRTTFLTSV